MKFFIILLSFVSFSFCCFAETKEPDFCYLLELVFKNKEFLKSMNSILAGDSAVVIVDENNFLEKCRSLRFRNEYCSFIASNIEPKGGRRWLYLQSGLLANSETGGYISRIQEIVHNDIEYIIEVYYEEKNGIWTIDHFTKKCLQW